MLDMCNLRNTRQQDMKNVNAKKERKQNKEKLGDNRWHEEQCEREKENKNAFSEMAKTLKQKSYLGSQHIRYLSFNYLFIFE